MVNLGGEKMAKSTGLVVDLRESLLDQLDPAALRLLYLRTHYRIATRLHRRARSTTPPPRWIGCGVSGAGRHRPGDSEPDAEAMATFPYSDG